MYLMVSVPVTARARKALTMKPLATANANIISR